MLNYLLITICFLMGSVRLLAQIGSPFIQSYPPSAYQSDAYVSSPQNWGMIQDDRGILYISNTSGVLEYDGINWHLVLGTAYQGGFQFAKNTAGTIYVGSNKDLGYLAPDTTGKMEFISLKAFLLKKHPEAPIKSIATLGQDVFFSTENHIFQWTGKQFIVWSSKAGFSKVFSDRKQLYAIDKGMGLLVLDKNKFRAIPGGDVFKEMSLTALIPFQDSATAETNFFVATFDKGLYLFKNEQLFKLNAKPDHTLVAEYFMHGLPLADSTIALATISQGVVIVDYSGQVKKVIGKKDGLIDNAVLSLYKDREGGLWASLNKGISRISYPSPVTCLNETSGLEGIVLSILKKQEKLYAGTSSGLFVMNEQELEPGFRKLPHLQHEVWEMLDLDEHLLVVTTPGVYLLKANNLERLSPKPSDIIYKSVYRSKKNPDKIYIGSSDGLSVVKKYKGKWQWEGKVKGLEHDVIWMAADKNNILWASCNDNISFIDDARDYGLQPPVHNFKPSAKLAEELLRFQVHAVKGKIYFGTSKGIYSLRTQGGRLKLLPDATFGYHFADGSREAINLTQTSKGEIWLTSEFRTGLLRKHHNKAYVWDTIPLSMLPRVDVWEIYSDPENVVWLGTTEGIYRYDPTVPKNYTLQPATVLRKIKLAGDSTVFFGAFAGKGAASLEQSSRFKFRLPHSIRSISFEYAATSFDAPDHHLYSYMLEGEDKKWSHWTPETKKEFTGLDKGDYVFKLRSKNIYGAISPVTTFEFESLGPFYLTWWAFSAYFILWAFMVWGIISVKHRHLIASKQKLEKLVNERTAELVAEKKKSDDLLLNILPAATAEELKANGRTVARRYDQVTVLFTDFKDFTRISEGLSPEELVAVIDFYFCAFDRIISKYKIEKIKTIGDAYMCAGGVPDPAANTPADVVKAGLEILAFVKKLNPEKKEKKYKFEIRIGIHTGPVVAGIVGTQKFAYDIWGDTVNTAARMESSCQEGKVNISGATYALVKDQFICTHRGKVDAKNKGEIDMYFVEDLIPEPAMLKKKQREVLSR